MIEETYTIRRRLPSGEIVAEARTRTRPATTTEAINALLEQIDQLDEEVFGDELIRDRALEGRVDAIERQIQ